MYCELCCDQYLFKIEFYPVYVGRKAGGGAVGWSGWVCGGWVGWRGVVDECIQAFDKRLFALLIAIQHSLSKKALMRMTGLPHTYESPQAVHPPPFY